MEQRSWDPFFTLLIVCVIASRTNISCLQADSACCFATTMRPGKIVRELNEGSKYIIAVKPL
jgi:hypothetical protein